MKYMVFDRGIIHWPAFCLARQPGSALPGMTLSAGMLTQERPISNS